MPTKQPTKQQRKAKLDKATSAADAGIAKLTDLSNSGNPNVAAAAMARLIEAGNVRDDLAAISAFLDTVPDGGLKPISDDDLAQLDALENAIDTRIQNNQLIQGGLTAATQIVTTAQSVGAILDQGKVQRAG